jgi:hypothetical protein
MNGGSRRCRGLGADDAGGHGVVEAERRTDGHHPLADAPCRIAERRPADRCVDLEQRHVGTLVDADQLGLEFALVGERDVDRVRLVTTWAFVIT